MSNAVIIALSACGLTAAGLALSAPAAEAAIVCRDGFQYSGGNWISTPYCNDADLARIAREHGVRVSAAEVRNNPAKKYEVCRFIGSSPAASSYCPDEDIGDSGR